MSNQRCHAIQSIRGHQGLISAHMQGTIEAEISNLGRHLIAVRWDNGLEMYVFPEEIEIDENGGVAREGAVTNDTGKDRAQRLTTWR